MSTVSSGVVGNAVIKQVGGGFPLSADPQPSLICYGAGKFVRLGYNPGLSYHPGCQHSTDGLVWTTVGAPVAATPNSLHYGGGIFVSFGDTSRVSASVDGSTWTSGTHPTGSLVSASCYGNGVHVASCGTRMLRSTDGLTWTSAAVSGVRTFRSVGFSAALGLFIALGSTTDAISRWALILTSVDGLTWTAVHDTGGIEIRCLATQSPNEVIVLGWNISGYAVAYRSTNGTAWSVSGTFPEYPGICYYFNSKFIAISPYSATVATSPDGTVWTSRTDKLMPGVRSLASSATLLLTAGQQGAGWWQSNSTDGVDWVGFQTSIRQAWKSVTYGNGIYVAVAADGYSKVASCSDGYSWVSRYNPFLDTSALVQSFRAVTHGNGTFVAVSPTSGLPQVMSSPDGVVWTSRTAASTATWERVLFGAGIFLAVATDLSSSYSYGFMASPDGVSWTGVYYSGASAIVRAATYGNGYFAVVLELEGDIFKVMRSANGTTWDTFDMPSLSSSSERYTSITAGDGVYYAITYYASTSAGSIPRVFSSGSLDAWSLVSALPAAAESGLYELSYSGRRIFAASRMGKPSFTSFDGINWTVQDDQDLAASFCAPRLCAVLSPARLTYYALKEL